jgi:hypothetical protein
LKGFIGGSLKYINDLRASMSVKKVEGAGSSVARRCAAQCAAPEPLYDTNPDGVNHCTMLRVANNGIPTSFLNPAADRAI